MDNKILTPINKSIVKHKIAAFDIEAADWTKFLIAGFYDGREYKDFLTIDSLINYMLRRKYAGYRIYAHNGGRYDFLFLLEKIKLPCDIIDINGRIFNIKIKLPNKRIINLIDSFYLLQFSLDSLIKTFIPRSEYHKIDIDFKTLKTVTRRLKQHLKNDCLALYLIIDKFQEIINNLGGELKSTLASTAMDIFRRKYLEIQLPTYFQLDKNIRAGYYGGRCEVFKKQIKDGYYYDFNSLYPSVMYDNYFPCGVPYYIDNYRFSISDIGFAYIKTNIKQNIPLLPYRAHEMLLFPNGNIEGIYSIEFLKKLKSLNIPFKTYYAILFDRDKIFKNYVSDLYKMRLENKNNIIETVVKLLLNSLYGKFGQRLDRKKYYIFDELTTDIINYHLYSAQYKIFYEEIETYLPYILPAIAAYVTTYSQLKLYPYLNKNTVYCDTDSIITTEQFKTGEKLGQLKLEDKINEGIFISQKIYAYKNEKGKLKKRAKGFPKDTLKNFLFKDFIFAVENNNYTKFDVAYKTIYGWKESIIRKRPSLLNYDERKKSIKNVDTKRKFYNKNKSVPIFIDN